MRKDVMKINGEIITGKWISPAGAARINGMTQHYNKCMDNFSITRHKKYRLLTFWGNELRIACYRDGSQEANPEGIDIIHGSTLLEEGVAKIENGHTVLND